MGRDSSKNEKKKSYQDIGPSLYMAWTQCLNIRKYISF